jgi:hypothetical protein
MWLAFNFSFLHLYSMLHNFLYIDPSSGSYLLQMIIAGILGSLFFFKNAWLKVKSFFYKKKDTQQSEIDNEL